jgi:hypothetical protein
MNVSFNEFFFVTGVTPRLSAFMLGGFVFFGVYDDAKSFIEKLGR